MLHGINIIIRFVSRTLRHAMAHSHEVLPGLIVEAPHLQLMWLLLIVGLLMVVFAAQALLNIE